MINSGCFYQEESVYEKSGQRKRRLKGAHFLVCLFMAAMILLPARPLFAGDGLIPMEILPEGSMVGVGIGAYPDYIGSDDYVFGAPSVLGTALCVADRQRTSDECPR